MVRIFCSRLLAGIVNHARKLIKGLAILYFSRFQNAFEKKLEYQGGRELSTVNNTSTHSFIKVFWFKNKLKKLIIWFKQAVSNFISKNMRKGYIIQSESKKSWFKGFVKQPEGI